MLSPAASKDIGQPNLEELTAGLPDLHLSTGKSSTDDKSALSSGHSIDTPLPSEASLARASTTSSFSGGTLSGDAAKAIESVRHSLEDKRSSKANQRSESSAARVSHAGESKS